MLEKMIVVYSISSRAYNILVEDSAIAWDCLICDCPNYSSVCFEIIPSTSNSFSILSDTSLQSPLPSDCIKPIHASTPDRKKQDKSPNSVPVKMLTVNFQSIKSKQGLVTNLVESTKPYIVLGTETWIDSSVKDNQIFPPNYNFYRNDRNMKGDGVLIAINNDHLSIPVPELQTNCEIVRAKISLSESMHTQRPERGFILMSYEKSYDGHRRYSHPTSWAWIYSDID
ncbi:unnamed protein product [Mytilus coruscus]|uniref:Endonuclease/exonuclease/phosphatase domain-containing protein n=1 Tax=Mytilus coruscus TaxID=42192 RepID=A0A6J8DCA6_MYTCO|nr:unnamed protein product [Mytilus coruscus]